jgi:hypothetical protein
MNEKKYNKVFGIGLNRTGTASLSAALNILGINTRHYCSITSKTKSVKIDDVYILDGAVDSTFKHTYPLLDKTFPLSKFILTIRDKEQWVTSVSSFGSHEHIKYDTYIKQVTCYFKNRNDLLMLNICDGEGWEKLCPFLGTNIPDVLFPNINKREK